MEQSMEQIIAAQLLAAAAEDDQLGRGEFQLLEASLVKDTGTSFVVTIQRRDDNAKPEKYRVTVEKEPR